jgi:N-dimethylarginine dimethylaminohydrolase
MPAFLICPPDYYGIEYEINPWMSRSRNSIPEMARRQWRSLVETLTQTIGAKVERIAPVRGLPDMVFTANAGLVVGNRFIGSRFRYEVRRKESPHYEAWFRDRGFQIHYLDPGVCFEGEGDALWVGETLFAGYRLRSDIQAHRRIAEILEKRVLSLELTDARFYHLDTCFCPLDDRRVLYYPPAFDGYARRVIEETIPSPIPVEEPDALRFGCNAVAVGRQVVMNAGCETLTRRLIEEGFTVHPLDLSEFIKAGGSAKCLVLRLE